MLNVLITGANSGFGLLTVRKFAEAGYTVHAGFRSKERARDLEALALEVPKIRPLHLDVTNQALINGAISEACKAGPIDILVNNAGFEVSCPVDTLCDDESSPHWANVRRYRVALQAILKASHASANPQEVADLVFEGTTTALPKFRYVAGADDRALIPAYQSQEFEQFRNGLLSLLGLADWEARC